MRTGSTWVHEVLVALLRPRRTDFVSTLKEALLVADAFRHCVLKSHSLVAEHLPELRTLLHTIRVLRNYKDSLISRSLYCRNVRRAEGLKNQPEEDAIIDACAGMSDRDFVNEFLLQSPLIPFWLREIVSFEPGDYDHTFYYEMLLHNPRDQFSAWMQRHDVNATESALDAALERCAFHRMKVENTPGFIGSTGVGQWMHWLTEPLWRRLDALYLQERSLANRSPRTNDLGGDSEIAAPWVGFRR